MSDFKYELGQKVVVTISGEQGAIKGRAEYSQSVAMYYVHYCDGNGCARDDWFRESDLAAV